MSVRCLAAYAVLLVSCGTATPAAEAPANNFSPAAVEAFKKAYRRTITDAHCAKTAPDKDDFRLKRELEKYSEIKAVAENEGLLTQMNVVEAEWQRWDSTADWVCGHSLRGAPPSWQSFHTANTELLRRIDELALK
jgi:hypothetical protein